MKRLAGLVLALMMLFSLTAAASDDGSIAVTVRMPTGQDLVLHVLPGTDTKDLIDLVSEAEDLDPAPMRLLYGTRLLEEDDTVYSRGMKEGDILYLLMEYPWEARYDDRYDEDEEHALWVDTLAEIENAQPGDHLQVKIGTYDTVPYYILEGLAGRGISLELLPLPRWGEPLTLRSDDIRLSQDGKLTYSLEELRELYGEA